MTSEADLQIGLLRPLAVWSSWAPLVEVAASAPRSPGVYLARRGALGPIVYVGMAGERRGRGLSGRLKVYVSGKGLVSGLGEAVLDRALADPAFVAARLAELEASEPRRAKQWGRLAVADADVHVAWSVTPDRASARALEEDCIKALVDAELWNRRR